MLPPDSQQLETFPSAVDCVLAEPLHVNSSFRLLVYGQRVNSVRISEHIEQLFVVKLDQGYPH